MKTKSTFAVLLLCALALIPSARSQGTNLTALLQQGLLEEQANRNLDQAIADYKTLATQFDQDRQLAATAVFRLGECYRAQGKTNDAVAQYERILRDFSDQTTLATMSRQNLAGMGASVKNPGTNENPDAKLWEQLKDLPRPEVEKLLPTLVPDAVLDQLLQSRNETEAKLSQLKVDYAPDNLNVVRQQTALNEINRQIGEKISGMLQGLKLRAELFTPPSQNDARRQQKELLAKQITLAEQDLTDTQKMFQVGKATQAEVRAAEREELRLRQQLVALDSVRTDLSNLSVSVSSEEDQEIARIQQMIQNSPDLINASAGLGSTPLQNAAINGWLKVAAFLLDHGAKVDAVALNAATKAGNRAMVELLLKRGADVNWTFNGLTPLHIAAQSGFQAVAEVLLANKADVNVLDSRGNTPLMLAAAKDNSKIVSLLLAHKADVNAENQDGASPLINAAYGGQIENMKLLLAAGANPNLETSSEMRGFTSPGFSGRTPLSFAAGTSSPEMVKMLLAAKADPNDGKFDAPLLCAIHKFDLAVAEMLLQAGANPNAKRAVNWTVDGTVSTVQFVNNPSRYALTTPLYLAIKTRQLSMVQLLLKFKADPNDSQTDGRPLLFDALSDTNILEALLAAGANIESHDTTVNVNGDRPGWTPLTAAVWEKSTNALEILLKHGANPNQRDAVGNVALHWAVSYLWGQLTDQNYRDAELLLTHGADPNVRNKDGYTPLDWVKRRLGANESSSDKVIAVKLADLLRQRGALDKLPDWNSITVSRPSANFSYALFHQGTNDWNRFSLYDALVNFYQSSQSYAVSQGNGSQAIYGLSSMLPFPDLVHVVIVRPSHDSTNETRITVNLLGGANGIDRTNDVPLEFGDVVEIPEREHSLGEGAVGLTAGQGEALADYAKGSAQLCAHGQTVDLVFHRCGNQATLDALLRQPAAQKILLSSSDLAQVKVIRRDSQTGKTREWILNCSKPEAASNGGPPINYQWNFGGNNYSLPSDLWLRNGDVIEVPEKP